MLEAALASWMPTVNSAGPVLLREPELPTGCPDVVALFRSGLPLSVPAARRRLTPRHFQLLQHLYEVKEAEVDRLADLLAVTDRLLAILVQDLAGAALVRVSDSRVRPTPLASVFGVNRIVAIEAKMTDWRTAITQASANTWFASESYVLLPYRSCVTNIAVEAERQGVGLLLFDGRVTECPVPAKAREIPASFGSWLLNEWLLLEAPNQSPLASHSGAPC
ncbi:MAG: hypothetical protein WCE40_04565 [Polyangia bacterium]